MTAPISSLSFFAELRETTDPMHPIQSTLLPYRGALVDHAIILRLLLNSTSPLTHSTIEVAHSRFFVSERRGSLTPSRLNVNLDFEN